MAGANRGLGKGLGALLGDAAVQTLNILRFAVCCANAKSF